MADTTTIDVLRGLYQAEFRCPTARLHQAMPYIQWSDTTEKQALHAIAAEDRQHLAWLTDLLLARGGFPPPASYATDSAALHYTQLDALLPRLIHAERGLIAAYQSAAAGLSDDPPAARVAADIVQRHSRHLAAFTELLRAPRAAT